MPAVTMAKKAKPADEGSDPKSDFFVRLPSKLAAGLARYVKQQRVKVQEQDVIRAALELFLRSEGCLPD